MKQADNGMTCPRCGDRLERAYSPGRAMERAGNLLECRSCRLSYPREWLAAEQ